MLDPMSSAKVSVIPWYVPIGTLILYHIFRAMSRVLRANFTVNFIDEEKMRFIPLEEKGGG
jgi:hypothetical protein